jgi:hypothetical protein
MPTRASFHLHRLRKQTPIDYIVWQIDIAQIDKRKRSLKGVHEF